MDAVVSTLVLCSVARSRRTVAGNPARAEAGRLACVYRARGRPRGTRLRRFQDLLCPLWKRMADGCHPNRETWASIEQAGFDRVHYEHFRLPLGPVGDADRRRCD